MLCKTPNKGVHSVLRGEPVTFNPETCDLCVHVKLRNECLSTLAQIDPLTVEVLLTERTPAVLEMNMCMVTVGAGGAPQVEVKRV